MRLLTNSEMLDTNSSMEVQEMFNFGFVSVKRNVRQGNWQRMWVRFANGDVELIGTRKGYWVIVPL